MDSNVVAEIHFIAPLTGQKRIYLLQPTHAERSLTTKSHMQTSSCSRYNILLWLYDKSKAGFARNPTRLGEARFPSPHADDVRA
ncbi:MAG: hypothetical protein FWH55_13885, partial [Oscillospiraceae bacterium]|nr:hypothetical protein [Oscillospiraceae bacterium]